MGEGYWILLWDGWGAGLVMLNPRMHSEGLDCYGNPRNWFPLLEGEEMPNGHDLRAKHGITAKHFQPIRLNEWACPETTAPRDAPMATIARHPAS